MLVHGRHPGLQEPPGPAHHLRLHQRRDDREAERRGPRLVRQPRPERPRQAAHDPDLPRRGHRGHAVHAAGGDHQLRDPQGQRRARQDAVVLRRPRRLPHRRRARRATSRPAVVAWLQALRRRATPRSTPARSSSGSPTTPSGARPPTTRSPRARRHRHRQRHARAQPRRRRLGHGRLRGPRGQRRQRRRAAAVRRAQILGEPRLELTYSGTGAPPHARLRPARRRGARRRGRQPGDADPGDARRPAAHDRRPLEAIAASAPAGTKYTLQLIGGTMLYGPVRAARRDHVQPGQARAADGDRQRDQRRRRHPRPDPHLPLAAALLDPRPRRAPEGHDRRQAREGEEGPRDRRPARQAEGHDQGQGQRPPRRQDRPRDADLQDLHPAQER